MFMSRGEIKVFILLQFQTAERNRPILTTLSVGNPTVLAGHLVLSDENDWYLWDICLHIWVCDRRLVHRFSG